MTLALAFATKRMTNENLLVRVLGSCETMANANVVCTDKTGTLTQNEMTVVAGSIGIHAKFVRGLNSEEGRGRQNVDEENNDNNDNNNAADPSGAESSPSTRRKHPEDFSLDANDLDDRISPELRALLNASISVNSTAFEDEDPATGKMVFIGSKTETALLKFAKERGWRSYREVRDWAEKDDGVVQVVPFSSARKAMGVVVRLKGSKQKKWRVYLKGASEILTARCRRHVVVDRECERKASGEKEMVDGGGEIGTAEIGELEADNISRTITFYAGQSLRTIALCYRDFEQWPPKGADFDEQNEVRVVSFFSILLSYCVDLSIRLNMRVWRTI